MSLSQNLARRPKRHVREATQPLEAVMVLLAIGIATFSRGAFFTGPHIVVLGVLALNVPTVLRGARCHHGPILRTRPALLASLAFTIYVALRGAAVGEFAWREITFGPAVALTYYFTKEDNPSSREILRCGVVILGVVVAMVGWCGMAMHFRPWATPEDGVWRAASTLTYANASASVLAVVLLMECYTRRLNPVVGYVLLVGIMVTLSRGSVLALLIGLLAITLQGRTKQCLGVLALPVLGSTAAMVTLLPSLSASSPTHTSLAVGGALVGLLIAVCKGKGLLVGGVLALAAVTVSVVGAPRAFTTLTAGSAPRLSFGSPDRVSEAEAALLQIGRAPIFGYGPGRLELRWTDEHGVTKEATFVHNEYLQLAGEFGVVGLLLFTAAVVAIWRLRRACFVGTPHLAVVLAVGIMGAVDFTWHVPAVVLYGAVGAGLMHVPAWERTLRHSTEREGEASLEMHV